MSKDTLLHAYFTAPLLASRMFEMDLLTTSENICRDEKTCKDVGHFAEAILRILSKTVSQEQICQMWSDADLKWDMFLPISDIDSFIKENVSIGSQNDCVQGCIISYFRPHCNNILNKFSLEAGIYRKWKV